MTNRDCLLGVLAAALLTCAPGLSAEQPVGLEAQGVDPWAALRNPAGLDVRDALGRPVSVKVIESQLTAARAEAAAQDAFASRLPQARVLARLLDRLEAFQLFLAAAASSLPWRRMFALPAGSRQQEKSLPLALIAAGLLALACLRRSPTPVALRCPPDQTNAVLRC